jgi:hypothetical protein
MPARGVAEIEIFSIRIPSGDTILGHPSTSPPLLLRPKSVDFFRAWGSEGAHPKVFPAGVDG